MDIVYETLKKIPGISDNEAHEVANKINSNGNVATKTDLAKLRSEVISEMYRLNNRTIMWMVGVGLAVIGVIKYL